MAKYPKYPKESNKQEIVQAEQEAEKNKEKELKKEFLEFHDWKYQKYYVEWGEEEMKKIKPE